MPIGFNSIPVAKIQQQKQQKKQQRKLGLLSSTPTKTLQQRAQNKRTTIMLAAYGHRLFEPAITREKPINVEFADFFVDNTRFSKDGFFAIKYIPLEHRCYLFYFINPVTVTKNITIELAMQEAVDYKSWEFDSSPEYVQLFNSNRYEDLVRIRYESALYKAEQQIIDVLRELRVAQQLLLRQKAIEEQELAWQDYHNKRRQQQEQQEQQEELEKQKQKQDSEGEGVDENGGDTEDDRLSNQRADEPVQVTEAPPITDEPQIQTETKQEDEKVGERVEGVGEDRTVTSFRSLWGRK